MARLHVLIAGGGVAAVEAALALRRLGGDRVRLELMAPGHDLVQRPESVGTPFTGVRAPRIPLERLAALGVDLRQDTLAGIDAPRHEVETTDGRALRYDALLIAPRARPGDSLPGAMHLPGPPSTRRPPGRLPPPPPGGGAP